MFSPDVSKFVGCLLGQCLGDALGFPVEGYPADACQAYVRTLPWGRVPFGRGSFVAGQYTDDSQLARELLASMVARGKLDPPDFARRILLLFAEHRIVGRGRATEEAARRLAVGIPWDQAGTPAPQAGNGSAMRAAPIGLRYYSDPDSIIAAAVDQGRITHRDPRASAGAVAIAGAVSLALKGQVEPGRFLRDLSLWAGCVDSGFGLMLRKLEDWLWLGPEEAVEHIRVAGKDIDDGWPGISPFVVGSVLWSLYSFLCSPDDYWQTVSTAIWPGGDVDTTAAMAGAISGAYLGVEKLPSEGLAQLTDQGRWKEEELSRLAAQLHRQVTARSRQAQPDRHAV